MVSIPQWNFAGQQLLSCRRIYASDLAVLVSCRGWICGALLMFQRGIYQSPNPKHGNFDDSLRVGRASLSGAITKTAAMMAAFSFRVHLVQVGFVNAIIPRWNS